MLESILSASSKWDHVLTPHAHSSRLKFSLSPGWAFVEMEGWRADLEGGWAQEAVQCGGDKKRGPGADEDGWIYTTDTWAHPRADARSGKSG
ncbi:hypothetical protein HYDPIDRAFT_43489 [Hydnomerulius pinastri MD-312]|uniref:TECPR1-like DysF domain-containing protein n=1 Tax=Hydnomerulius pinastri MD-312 TaxID=994086 RepID=A0A0C9V4B1_9AGAM|nr:hypothetical protein HYDPIDRAFT_43489 [Hydnomerulius pinastri MD-312]